MGARAKSYPLHWPRNYPKKCKLSRFDETQVKRREFSTIFAIAWKIRRKQPGEEKTLVLRLLYKILGGGRDGDLWMSDWRTHSDFWLQLSSAHVMIERGGGSPRIERSGQLGQALCLTPGSNVTLSQLQFAEYITAQKTVITLRDGDYTIMQTGCTDLGYYLMTLAIMMARDGWSSSRPSAHCSILRFRKNTTELREHLRFNEPIESQMLV